MSVLRVLLIASVLGMAASESTEPDEPSQGRLCVVVLDLASNEGAVMIYIHERPTFVKKNLSKRENGVCLTYAKARIVDHEVKWTTDPLPYGEYAIIVHHDLNEDGVVNFGMLIPSEPIGYSNYHHAIAAYPDFDTARVKLNQPTCEIAVEAFMQGRIFRRQLKE